MPHSCIWVYDVLQHSDIFRRVRAVYRSDNYMSICLIVSQSRFFSEFIYIQRTSHARYYVSCGDRRYKAERYTDVLPIVEKLVNEILAKKSMPKDKWIQMQTQQRLYASNNNLNKE